MTAMDREGGHTPVLRDEVIGLLCPAGRPAGRKVLVDCTVGAGGHCEAILTAADPDATMTAIDVDPANLRAAKGKLARFQGRVRYFQANFSELPAVMTAAGLQAVDAIVADLGLASTQLDDPGRGFSFTADGPLDMRMDDRLDRTAAELVNTLGEKLLADLIYANGQERYSRRIAKAIVAARKADVIRTTVQLAGIVQRAYPAATRKTRRGVHPATRTFQALRIAVNDEMGHLDRLLGVLAGCLAPGGRAAIISFHSLEDRRVKHAFAALAEQGLATVLTRKPIVAGQRERMCNPRSRSAKLRGMERTSLRLR